ncbi:MAG TPA: hypothetical protein VHW00_19685 [Thermoanaerobaculia bacterium]|nr:hypothetical protein [Thermoanaerobaculia bacterium]
MLATRVWNALTPLANLWTIIALTLLFWLFSWLFARQGAQYPALTLDGRRNGFRPDEVHGILKQFHDKGQLCTYLEQEWKLDLIFPLIYGGFFAAAIVAIGNRVHAPHWLLWVPIVMTLADYVENFTVMALISNFHPTEPSPRALTLLVTIASRVKWGGLLLSALIVAGLCVAWGWRNVGAIGASKSP